MKKYFIYNENCRQKEKMLNEIHKIKFEVIVLTNVE